MHTKYITSCSRPPVWQHLRANCSTKCGLCLLITWWRIVLLPSCLQPTSRLRTTTQYAFTPAISLHQPFNLPHQPGLCAQSLARETGQPPSISNSCRLHLVYSQPARCTVYPTVGQTPKPHVRIWIMISLPVKIKIQTLNKWLWPSTFNCSKWHLWSTYVVPSLRGQWGAILPLTYPLIHSFFLQGTYMYMCMYM